MVPRACIFLVIFLNLVYQYHERVQYILYHYRKRWSCYSHLDDFHQDDAGLEV